MTGEEFTAAWLKFISGFLRQGVHAKKSLHVIWHDKTAWTCGTIGLAHAWGEESPLGDALVMQFGRESWRYWKEYRGIDLVLSRHPNVTMPYLWTTEQECNDWPVRFCPEALDIVIEHEDSCGISWQEMVKLIHVRARLKVLITYTSDLNEREQSAIKSTEHIVGTRTMFQAMIQQACAAFPEDPGTTYLLIIGQLDESGASARFVWHNSIFAYENGTVQAVQHTTVDQPS